MVRIHVGVIVNNEKRIFKEGSHFTQSAGLVALHPLADALVYIQETKLFEP